MRVWLVLSMLAGVAQATEHAECTGERRRVAALKDVLASVGETTAEYRAMLVKRIQDAETAAANCERSLVEAKRAADARSAAQKRDEEAAAKKAAAERFAVDEMKSQAEFIRLAWSAYACTYEKERETILDNPFATPEQKEALRRAETMIARVRAAMKRVKMAQLPCRAEDVAKLAFCIGDASANPACSQSPMALMIRAERELVDSGQVMPSAAPLSPREQHAKAQEDDMRILLPQF